MYVLAVVVELLLFASVGDVCSRGMRLRSSFSRSASRGVATGIAYDMFTASSLPGYFSCVDK
jgi:hypothetical protein